MDHGRDGWYVAVVPALLTFVVCVVGIGQASLWQDELATLSASARSLPDLVLMTRHMDAVLGPYYAFMHVWTAVAGSSATALRLPSALAMALTAAVVAVLGRRLFTPAAGLCAGLVVALTPSVAQYGQEARPYAMTFLFVAVSTLALVAAVQSPTGRAWWLYAGCLVVLGLLQLTAMAVVLPHLGALAVAGRQIHEPLLRHGLLRHGLLRHGLLRHGLLRHGIVSAAGAVVVLAPVFVVGHLQSSQIDWIPETTWPLVRSLPLGIYLAPLVGAAVIALALAGAAGLRPPAGDPGARFAVVLAVSLSVLPLVLIVVVSTAMPLVRVRYLLYTQLGWALLAGVGIARLGRRPAALVLVGLVALAVPMQLDLRADTKNNGPDYRALARVLAAHEQAGDAIVVPTDKGVRFRVGLQEYLSPGELPRDVLARIPAAPAQSLDAKECRPATCVGTPARIWVGCRRTCSNPLSSLRSETAATITGEGYRLARTWVVPGGALSLWTRPT